VKQLRFSSGATSDQPAGSIDRSLWPGRAIALLLLLSSAFPIDLSAGWLTSAEQRARAHFAKGQYEAAAAEFRDAYRRGVALYRAGSFRDAAQAFASVERAEVKLNARYNLGNAWFQLGEYEQAIEAYEAVLAQHPDQADAKHNLALAKRLLHEQRSSTKKTEMNKAASAEEPTIGRRPTTQDDASETRPPGQDREAKQDPSESEDDESASEQEQNRSETGETSNDDSGESENESTAEGEGKGQRVGQEGEQSSSSEGGSAATSSGEKGSSSSGGESALGNGSLVRGRTEEKEEEGEVGTRETRELTGNQPDRSSHRDEGQASHLPDDDHQSGSTDQSTERESGNVSNANEGKDDAATAEPVDRSEAKPQGDAVGRPLLTGAAQVDGGDRGQGDDQGEGTAAATSTDLEPTPQRASEVEAKRSGANQGVAPGREQTGEGEPMAQPGDPETSRAVDLSQFDRLRRMWKTVPGEEEGTALGLNPRGAGALTVVPGSGADIEEWLDRIGSNPAPLLRSRFLLEERAAQERQGGNFSEPRPW
jgi:Ca-activated chloride channel family protein